MHSSADQLVRADSLDELLLVDVDVTDLVLDIESLSESGIECTAATSLPVHALGPDDAQQPSETLSTATLVPSLSIAPSPARSAAAPRNRLTAPDTRMLRPIRPAAAPPVSTTAPATARTRMLARSIHSSAVQRTTAGRKRVKDELERLRDHVARLEAQLQELHRVDASRKTERTRGGETISSNYSSSNYSSSNTHSAVAVSHALRDASPRSSSLSPFHLWKRVARRQLDARRRSETENARLRDLLEAQLTLAQRLARALRRQPSPSDLELQLQGSSEFQCRLFRADPSARGAAIYRQLTEALDATTLNVDAVHASAGFSRSRAAASAESEGCAGHVKIDRVTGDAYLELASSITVPFGLETSSAGFWAMFHSSPLDPSAGGATPSAQRPSAANAFEAQYHMDIPMRRGDVVVRGHIVCKRVVDRVRRRVVFIWCMAGECDSDVLGDTTVRSRLHETGSAVVYECSRSDDAQPSSVIQSVVHLHPTHGSSGAAGDGQPLVSARSVHAFADAIMASLQQAFKQAQRRTETAILRIAVK